MLSKQSLKEILELLKQSDGSFVVLEKEEPKIAVLDFKTYEKLIQSGQKLKSDDSKIVVTNFRILFYAPESAFAEKIKNSLQDRGNKVFASNLENAERVLSEEKIDKIVFLPSFTSHSESFNSPDKAYSAVIGEALKLLTLARQYGVNDFLFIASEKCNSPLSTLERTLENLLRFYHQVYGLNSISLKLPKITQPDFESRGTSELIFDNPVLAVFEKAKNPENPLPLPYWGDLTTDGTPEVKILGLPDAASAVVFALEHLAQSSGSRVMEVDGLKISLACLVEKFVEQTGKMIITTHVSPDPIWDEAGESTDKLLSTLGWQGKESLEQIVENMWGGASNNELQDQASRAGHEPVSLNELLSGKFTPFIKPHNS